MTDDYDEPDGSAWDGFLAEVLHLVVPMMVPFTGITAVLVYALAVAPDRSGLLVILAATLALIASHLIHTILSMCARRAADARERSSL